MFEFSKLSIFDKDIYTSIDSELKVFGYNQNYIEHEIEVLKTNNDILWALMI